MFIMTDWAIAGAMKKLLHLGLAKDAHLVLNAEH
jgi:hypothetical protein